MNQINYKIKKIKNGKSRKLENSTYFGITVNIFFLLYIIF